MANELRKETISTIEKALEEEQNIAITEIIQIIQELASKAFSISIPELSQLIGRDSAITEKVISAANTLGFNPSGAPISTITEAIHAVGFEKIRNLAISLLLVENAGHKLNSYEQREIAALAVCSGMMAQNLAKEQTQRSIDPELAFVCTSLRNYGKLLMTSFLLDKYREAKSLALDMEDDDEAFKQVFGLTPLALGQYLLQSTNLPKPIMSSFRSIPPEVLERAASGADEEILVLADLSVKVCEVAFDEEVGPDDFNDSMLEVLETFGRSFPVALESVNQSLIDIDNNLQTFNRAIGAKDLSSPATSNLRARLSGEPIPKRPKETQITAKPKPKTIQEMNKQERDDHAEKATEAAIELITKRLIPGTKVKIREVYEAAAKAIMDGLGLSACMIFVAEEIEPDSFSARFGYGNLFDRVKNRPVVSRKKKDVFSISLARGEDILIQDINAGKVRSVVPEWVVSNSKTTSFILLPVVADCGPFAVIFGSTDNGTIELQEGDLRRLKIMRVHLATLKNMLEDRSITEVA